MVSFLVERVAGIIAHNYRFHPNTALRSTSGARGGSIPATGSSALATPRAGRLARHAAAAA